MCFKGNSPEFQLLIRNVPLATRRCCVVVVAVAVVVVGGGGGEWCVF